VVTTTRCTFFAWLRHAWARRRDRQQWAITGYTPETTFEAPHWNCPCGQAAKSDWDHHEGLDLDPPL
jgi:hypothetical protein